MNKLTLVFFGLSLVLGGIAYYEYENSKEEKAAEALEAQIVGWGEREHQEATLTKDGKTLRVEKRQGNWWVVEPLEDFADQFNVNSWVGDIATEKGKKLEAKTTANGEVFWAEYGLDRDLTKITLKSKDGETAELEFSKNAAFDGQYFAKYRDAVYVAVRPWTGVMAKTADNLRSRDVFREKKPISKVHIQVGAEDFVLLQPEPETWKFEGESPFPLDTTAAVEFGRQLSGLRIQSFIDEAKEVALPARYGLKKPLGSLKVTTGDREIQVDIGMAPKKSKEDEEKYYAKVSDAAGFYELNAAAAKSLLKSKQDFMSKTVPFDFDLTKAKTLELSRSGETLKVEKDVAEWKLVSLKEGKELNVTELESFLSDLKGLAANEYVAKPKKAKFDNRVVIKAADGAEIFNFAWTNKGTDDSILMGVSNLVDAAFNISASKIQSWDLNRFLKSPTQGTSATEKSSSPVEGEKSVPETGVEAGSPKGIPSQSK